MIQNKWRGICAIVLSGFFFGSAASMASVVDSQLVIASQGGQDLTYADVDESVQRIPEADRAHFLDSPKRIEALISNILLQKQLAAQARAAGLDKDPEIAAATGLQQVQLLAAAQSKKFLAGIKTPDVSQLAKEEYIAHRERYDVPTVVDVQQILVSSTSRTEDEALAIATKVRDEAVANPDQFDALVEKYSDDAKKATNAGLVKDAGGAFHASEYAKAASALSSPGEISGLVKTDQGFYIFKLVAKTPGQKKTFDEVRDQIAERLTSEYIRKQQTNYIDGLRNNRMDANPERVASLRTRFVQQAPPPVEETIAPAAGKAPKKK